MKMANYKTPIQLVYRSFFLYFITFFVVNLDLERASATSAFFVVRLVFVSANNAYLLLLKGLGKPRTHVGASENVDHAVSLVVDFLSAGEHLSLVENLNSVDLAALVLNENVLNGAGLSASLILVDLVFGGGANFYINNFSVVCMIKKLGGNSAYNEGNYKEGEHGKRPVAHARLLGHITENHNDCHGKDRQQNNELYNTARDIPADLFLY